MPELPEVETIKNQILPHLPFKVVSVTYSEVAGSIIKDREFSPRGKVLHNIRRKGKVLLFEYENDLVSISGLGMSGGWRVSPQKIDEKHTHVQIKGTQKNGDTIFLAYVDPRRFGNLHHLKKEGAAKWLTRLGADVSSEDFTVDYIYSRLKRYPNKEIKPFLLEQNHFAGVGNYMASEVCAHARILPHRRNRTLTKTDAKNIREAMRIVLDATINFGGTTFSGGYKDTSGNTGDGVKNLVVFYQQICGLCKCSKVIKTTLKGRGTYHCPVCQR